MSTENCEKMLLVLRKNEWITLELSSVIAKIIDEADVKPTKEDFKAFFEALAEMESQEGLTLKLAKY